MKRSQKIFLVCASLLLVMRADGFLGLGKKTPGEVFRKAAAKGDIARMDTLLQETDLDINEQSHVKFGRSREETALYKAGKIKKDNARLATVRWLLNKGADPDIANRTGETTLHYAAYKGHNGVAKELLLGGEGRKVASAIQGDKYERTPLHYAAMKGHVDVVKTLINGFHNLSSFDKKKLGHDLKAVDLQDKYGKTALHYASDKVHPDVVDVLLLAGANVKIQSEKYKRTALHYAIGKNKLDDRAKMVEMLAEKTESMSPPIDKYGRNPLHSIIKNGKIEIIKSFFNEMEKWKPTQRKAWINRPDETSKKWTPMHYAAKIKGMELRIWAIKELIIYGGRVSIEDSHGRTAQDLNPVDVAAAISKLGGEPYITESGYKVPPAY